MSKGTLLETCLYRKERGIPIVFSFIPQNESMIPAKSVVTSLGKFKTYATVDVNGHISDNKKLGTYLNVMTSLGPGWIRIRNLVQHRPEHVEGRVIERPRRLSSIKSRKKSG